MERVTIIAEKMSALYCHVCPLEFLRYKIKAAKPNVYKPGELTFGRAEPH